MTLAIVVWVIFLAWLTSLLQPSKEMLRDNSVNGTFYVVWTLVFGSVLIGEFYFMAKSGHTILAVISDIIGIGIGSIVLWGGWLQRKKVSHELGLSSPPLYNRSDER